MNDILSRNWLITCAGIAAVVIGIHPSVLSYIILVMGFLWIFIWRDANGRFAKPNPTTVILFLITLVYATIALQWSLIPARALYDLLIMGLLTWIGLQTTAGMAALEGKAADRLMHITIAGFMVALICFAADLFFDVIVQRALQNAPWSKALPLALSTRSCFCIVLLLWPAAVYIWQRGWRISAISLCLIVGILTIFADTAAGRLAFALSSFTFMIAKLSPRFIRILFSAIILAGFMIAVPVAQIAQDTIGDQAHRMSNSFGQRTEIWKFTAKRILEKPIFGWGFDSARAIPNFGEVSLYLGNDPTKSIIPMHPHNWFLQVLLELGAVGAILVSVFWIWLIWQIEKLNASVQPAALAAVGVIFIIGAFSIGIWQAWWWATIIFTIWVLQWLDRTQSNP